MHEITTGYIGTSDVICCMFVNHCRLLEEALFEGQWIICLVNSNRGQRLQQMNYIRFLLEKCSPSTGLAKTQHFHFRLWILCDSDRDFRPLTPMTAPSHCIALNRANQVYSLE